MARPLASLTTSWQWVRHYLASIVATAVDYATMVTLVEVAHRDPVSATGAGAFAGAVTNFILGRVFTYGVTDRPIGEQAARYVLVSAGSLGLNAAGEHLFANVLGMQYIVARLVTSFIVSTAWNYPLQRFYVFSRRSS